MAAAAVAVSACGGICGVTGVFVRLQIRAAVSDSGKRIIDHINGTYVRKDVFEEYREAIDSKLEGEE